MSDNDDGRTMTEALANGAHGKAVPTTPASPLSAGRTRLLSGSRGVAMTLASGREGPGSSRAATEQLLGGLRADRWTASAWRRFAVDAFARSARQARAHPLALAEVTALQLAFGALSPRGGWGWLGAAWMLSAGHLGMLEDRRHLGWSNALSLARANVPALGRQREPWMLLAAALSDAADGAIARRTGTVTPFGRYADFIADTALWTWYALHDEPSRLAKAATVGAWALPVAGVAAASFAGGRMVDVRRSRWWRPCATLQAVLVVRALLRRRGRCRGGGCGEWRRGYPRSRSASSMPR